MNHSLSSMKLQATDQIDPVQLEIMRTGLQSIPDLVEADLMRTAFSPLIYEYKDYAVGIVDAQGRSIALATSGLPLFLTNLIGLAVRDGLAIYGEDGLQPGDVIITNNAATIGQHLNNVVMYTPVFADDKIFGFVSLIVHWIDIGGTYPGSASGTDMTELVQEGLQLHTVKLYQRGQPVMEIFRIIEGNTRQKDMLMGDIAAQYSGCIKGHNLLSEFLNRYGAERVKAAIQQIFAQTEAAARAAVEKVPDGMYRMKSFLDDDGVDIGKKIPVDITVEIKGSDFIVDFSNIGNQLRGPFNSGYHGGGEVCARMAFRYLFMPHELANEGLFAPVKLILPDGKFLSAGANAPMGRYSTPLATVVDTIVAALAPAMPDHVAAGHHGALNAYGFNGRHPETGKFFSYFDTAHGGWGAGARQDGLGPYKTMIHGDNKDIPVEIQEALYPVRVERFEWRTDSGGAGRHRGGLGIEKVYRVLADCNGYVSFERHFCAPWGLMGGHEGNVSEVELETHDDRFIQCKASRVPLKKGDRMFIRSGAGGGYGPPTERNPEAVRLDVLRGYVSPQKARDLYGVVLKNDGQVDEQQTAQRRA